MDPQLEKFLNSHQIKYKNHDHPAIFTVAEAKNLNIPGLLCKSLFLRDKKDKTKFFLLVMEGEKRLSIKNLTKQLGLKHMSFATPEKLKELLNLTPGSVNPFGLLKDPQANINLLIDQTVWDAPIVSFHPNVNTASLELDKNNFHKFIAALPHTPKILTIE